MGRTMINELRFNALSLFTVFLFENIICLFLARMHELISGDGITVGIATTLVMVLALFLREEIGKTQVISRSLPVPHATIVASKYLLIIVLLLANVAYGFSMQVINAYVGPWVREGSRHYFIQHMFWQYEAGYAIEHSLLARAIVMTGLASIGIPLIVRFGSVWKILAGFLILMLTWSKVVNRLLEYSLQTALTIGLSRWLFFAIGLMLISLGLSWRLSTWLYGRRDL